MKKKKHITIFLILSLCFVGFLCFENNAISTSIINITSNRLPQAFDNFKILQLSDLHSKYFGKGQKNIVGKIRKIGPDMIVFTGDLIDSSHYDEEPSMELMKEAVKIAPVYYVTGNHERWSGKFDSLEKKLKDVGIKALRNTNEKVTKGQDDIYIAGIDDTDDKSMEYEINTSINGMDLNSFKILLSHRPELFNLYSRYGFDLIFSGHAHGGQIRLPFIGSLVAPGQGFFPKYTAGKYTKDTSIMVVNRGLGNSIIPQRVFNRPEIVVTVLKSQK